MEGRPEPRQTETPPGSLGGRLLWALLTVGLAVAAFEVWLSYRFWDGPSPWRWMGSALTTGLAVHVGWARVGRTSPLLLVGVPASGTGWVTFLTEDESASDLAARDGLAAITSLMAALVYWPWLVFAVVGLFLVTFEVSANRREARRAAARVQGHSLESLRAKRAEDRAEDRRRRVRAAGWPARVRQWWGQPREGTEYATRWTFAGAEEWSDEAGWRPPAGAALLVVHLLADEGGGPASGTAARVEVDGAALVTLRAGRRHMIVTPAGQHELRVRERRGGVGDALLVDVGAGEVRHLGVRGLSVRVLSAPPLSGTAGRR